MELDNLRALYIDELKDLYSAENQLVKALPKMAKAAAAPELREAFENHLQETKGQVDRLEQIFESLEGSPKGKKCAGMEGLIEEGKEIISEHDKSSVRDAALICAAQKVEHYEIAAYGCARTFAQLLGMEEAVQLLQETLDEEGNTDKKLTELAETIINVEAEQEGEEVEEDTRSNGRTCKKAMAK